MPYSLSMSNAPEAPEIRIGQCCICSKVYRAGAGTSVWCDCRQGIPCEIRYGMPKCGADECHGHIQTAIRFKAVKVTYKAEKACGGSCWTAKSTVCTCSCNGRNHGGVHAADGNF